MSAHLPRTGAAARSECHDEPDPSLRRAAGEHATNEPAASLASRRGPPPVPAAARRRPDAEFDDEPTTRHNYNDLISLFALQRSTQIAVQAPPVGKRPASGAPPPLPPAHKRPASGAPPALPPAHKRPASGAPPPLPPAHKRPASGAPPALPPSHKRPASGAPPALPPSHKHPASGAPPALPPAHKRQTSGTRPVMPPPHHRPASGSPPPLPDRTRSADANGPTEWEFEDTFFPAPGEPPRPEIRYAADVSMADDIVPAAVPVVKSPPARAEVRRSVVAIMAVLVFAGGAVFGRAMVGRVRVAHQQVGESLAATRFEFFAPIDTVALRAPGAGPAVVRVSDGEAVARGHEPVTAVAVEAPVATTSAATTTTTTTTTTSSVPPADSTPHRHTSAHHSSHSSAARGDVAAGPAGPPREDVVAGPEDEAFAADESPGEVPSADQIERALEQTRRYSQPCIDGHTGWTRVDVTFANSGRVTTVNVGLPLAGTAVGSCLAVALRHARVRPFAGPSFSTRLQYRVDAPP